MTAEQRPGIPGRIRAGAADRSAALHRLGAHLAEGRLTVAEYDERAGAAARAVHLDELGTLFADLPPDPTGPPEPGPPEPPRAAAWLWWAASGTPVAALLLHLGTGSTWWYLLPAAGALVLFASPPVRPRG
ncbi:hypothetical protein GCM10009613_62600 [Pseudonocardia kongjuensis]|uniref:DUF1707 domain-containing protein n=1 Tax=Pseudonocardia kongjuensis TaxID=102227 RepID=A0ABP4J2Q0_9PSEU